ncbi:tetratricopeptide repeat protein [Flavobacterium sp. SUN046]|uniref:tetratricopeptide repeat protein n=1 Tax=Flavobacterium sp. SUN046 TaxID=3002440 RepID=UPI002DBF31BF|nr:tetratricopeptide repeat protein [Flavobacterium sp. SUN046]MEC4049455.1 tetratricopeptide repeat protein [Flavobacterium sp. SUN046]
MKRLLMLAFLLSPIYYSLGQNLKEEYLECSRQKFYIEDFKGAIDCLDKIIALNPKDSTAYNERGGIKEIMHDYMGAIADFTKEISIDPTFADSYFFRGMSWDKLKNRKAAIADYKMALQYEPDNSDIYLFIGRNQFAMGDKKNAIANYKTAITKRADNHGAYAELGLIKGLTGNYNQAINYCNQAISFDPTLEKAYYYKAWIQVQQQQYPEALKTFEKAVKINYSIENDIFYGKLKRDYKGIATALAEYNKQIVNSVPDSSATATGLINLYLKEYKMAVKHFNQALATNSKNETALYYSAIAHIQLKEYIEAEANLTDCIALQPKKALYYKERGALNELQKELTAAIEDYSNAIAIDGFDFESYYKRGQLYLRINKKELAQKDLTKFKELGGSYSINTTNKK